MATESAHHTEHLPDGSAVRYRVRAADPTTAAIFEAALRARLRTARRVFAKRDLDRRLAGYATAAGGADGHSTRTHDLPSGTVTVAIEADGRGRQGYLRHLVGGAVAYTHVMDIEVGRATVLAGLLLGTAVLLFGAGQPHVGAPFLGAGGMVGAYVGLYGLSALGYPVHLSKPPRPSESS